MKMRRTIALCLTLVICASLAIGGTMAYLQDTDSDVNVMTLGSVYIDQKEYERVNDSALNLNDSNLKDFVFDDPSQQNPHPLFPAIGELTSKDAAWRGTEDTMPLWTNANVQDKFVTVENTGRSEAFVRTLFAVEAPANVAHPLVLNWNKNGEWDITPDPVLTVSLTKEGVTGTYDIYVANFNGVMAPKYESLPSLLQVALPCEAGNKDVEAYGDRLEIYVLTQAMQVNGFNDAESAFTAGFGDVTADNVQTWFEGITPPTNTETGDEADLKAVLAAATAGEPAYITLTGNVTYETTGHHGEDNITPASRVVIDGQGYTITFTGSGVTPFGDTEAPITLKNLKVVDESVSYNEGAWELLYLEMGGPELICENVDFTEARISCDGQNATFVNCKFAGAPSEYAVWVSNGNAEFVNCSFTGARGLKMHEDYGSEIGHVYVEDCDFGPLSEKPGVAIGTLNADTKVVLENNTFSNTQPGDQGLYTYETDTDVTTFDFTDEGNIIASFDTVSTEAELATKLAAAGAAGAGNSTIEITADLNMSSIDWTPIKVDGYHGADIVTIDGKGHTITGLKAPLFAGGFAGGSGIVIKDLTIADSNIVSTNTLGSGAFVESIDSMDKIELTNCHLKDSTVTGGSGSRTGGLIGWTAGYNNQNDGPVKTYVTIKNCSVINCEITCDGSVGGIYGHAGNNAWTYSTVEDCIVKDCKLNSTDDGEWRVGVVVGTANVGEMIIKNVTESGNTLTQTDKTAPAGQSNLYGRFVPGSTGKLTIDGVSIN